MSCGCVSGVNSTFLVSRGRRVTSREKIIPSSRPSSRPVTSASAWFTSSAETVSRASAERLEVQFGHDEGVLDRDIARGPHPDAAEEAHGVVGRGRVPIDPADRRLALFRRDDLHGEDVLLRLPDVRRHVDGEAPVGAVDGVRAGHLLPVEPDVGPVVDAVELEPRPGQAGADRHDELLAVPPGHFERRRGHGLEVLAEEDVRIDVALDEGPEDRRGHHGRIPGLDPEPGLGDLLARPLGLLGGLEVPEIFERDGELEGHVELGFLLGPGLLDGAIGVLSCRGRSGQDGEQKDGGRERGGRATGAGAVGSHNASHRGDASIISEPAGPAKRCGSFGIPWGHVPRVHVPRHLP